jgi:hypothetical protein
MKRACSRCATPAADNSRYCRHCGAPLTSPWFRLPRGLNVRWILIIAAAMLVLGSGGALWFSQNVAYPPEQPVQDWFDALARRDAAAARELAGGLSVLGNDSLKAGYEPPSNLEVLGVDFGGPQDNTRRPNKNVAYVKVRYVVATQVVEGRIQVWRDRSGPVRPWSLGDGATGPLFVLTELVPHARVAGVNIATVKAKPANGIDGAVWVPPGVYTITGVDDDPLFTSKQTSAVVRAGEIDPVEPTAVDLELAAKPPAVQAIEAQIRKRLDECAQLADLALNACPFGYRGLDGIGALSVRWHIERYPSIELTPSANPYLSGGQADVRTVQVGHATTTYTRLGAAETRTVDISVRGAARVMPDKSLCWNERSSALAC